MCNRDHSWQANRVVTSMGLFRRAGDSVYTISTEYIAQITNFSTPVPEIVIPTDIFIGLNNTLGEPSSNTSTQSAYYINFLLQSFEVNDDPFLGPQQYLRQLLTSLLVWYQDNNLGAHSSNGTKPNLESYLYVNANVAKAGTRLVVSVWTAIVFTAVGVAVLLWCVLCRLIFRRRNRVPEISAFPLLDFASVFPPEAHAWEELFKNLEGSGKFREKYQGKPFHVDPVVHAPPALPPPAPLPVAPATATATGASALVGNGAGTTSRHSSLQH
jgi:hypothetical protein